MMLRSLPARIVALTLALIATGGVALGLVAWRSLQLIDAQQANLSIQRVVAELAVIESALDNDRGLSYCALTGDRGFLAESQPDALYVKSRVRLTELLEGRAVSSEEIQRLDALWRRWQDGYLSPMQAWCVTRGGVRPDAADVSALREGSAAVRGAIRTLLREIQNRHAVALVGLEASAAALRQRTIQTVIGASVLTLVLILAGLLSTLRLARRIEGMNRELMAAAETRRTVQSRAAESERYLRAVMENLPVAVFITNTRGVIEALNPAAGELLQQLHRADAALPARGRSPYWIGRDLPFVAGSDSGASKELFETELVGDSDRRIPVEVSRSVVVTGAEQHLVFVARDITERRRVESMKSEFLSTVSHELRTPVTSIRGALALLHEEASEELPADVRKLIDIAHSNAEQLVRLISDIVDMERLEVGLLSFDLVPMKLVQAVRQAVAMTQSYAADRRLRVALEFTDESVTVLGDDGRLQQVVVNLLSNAMKYSPLESQVTVRVHEAGNMGRVAVLDNGPGVPEEFRTRIFQKFSQADSSNRRATGGSGLGLAIARSLVERMHGRIGFRNRPEGGAEFWFDVPLFGAAQVSAPGQSA